jgi:hypothetical protein
MEIIKRLKIVKEKIRLLEIKEAELKKLVVH